MKNKYTILSCMYSDAGKYLKKDLSAEELQDKLAETKKCKNFIIKSMIKRSLKSNFDIIDEQSSLNWVNFFYNYTWIISLKYHLITKIYLEHPTAIRDSEQRIKIAKEYTKPDEIRNIINKFLADESIAAKDKLAVSVEKYFFSDFEPHIADDLAINSFCDFLDQFDIALIKTAQPFALAGFDYARAIDILASANNVGYLTDDKTTYLLNLMGADVERWCSSWNEYLASCILGKLWMEYGDDDDDTSFWRSSALSFIEEIYLFTVSPKQPLINSGLWPESPLDDLAQMLKPLLEKSSPTEATRRINKESSDAVAKADECIQEEGSDAVAMVEYIQALVKANDLNYYFDHSVLGLRDIYFAKIDNESDYKNFSNSIASIKKKYKLDFATTETVFMLIDDKWIFTNKKIYHIRKKGTFSKEIETIDWQDMLVEAKLDWTDWMNISICGNKCVRFSVKKARLSSVPTDEKTIVSVFNSIKEKCLADINAD